MIEKTLVVLNKKGIHARPASQVVQIASKFNAQIHIIHDENEINAKSIIGILTLGITYKEKITIKADGKDEEQALAALIELFENVLIQ